MKTCPAQNDTSMEAMEANSDVKPRRSFLGKSDAKSFSWYREVRIERKKTSAVMEKQRATNDEMAKASKAGLSLRVGVPLSDLTPPGTVDDVVNATVAMSAATTEQDSEVLASHSLPSLIRVSCVRTKTSFGVSLSLL